MIVERCRLKYWGCSRPLVGVELCGQSVAVLAMMFAARFRFVDSCPVVWCEYVCCGRCGRCNYRQVRHMYFCRHLPPAMGGGVAYIRRLKLDKFQLAVMVEVEGGSCYSYFLLLHVRGGLVLLRPSASPSANVAVAAHSYGKPTMLEPPCGPKQLEMILQGGLTLQRHLHRRVADWITIVLGWGSS